MEGGKRVREEKSGKGAAGGRQGKKRGDGGRDDEDDEVENGERTFEDGRGQ